MMAGLSNRDVGATAKEVVVAPVASPEKRNFITSVTKEKNIPFLELGQFVEGFHTEPVEYLSRLLGPDEELGELSTSLNEVLQQYLRIPNFEIKLSDSLQRTFEKDRQSNTFTGNAIIYAGTIVPKRYDHFVADVGDDVPYLFTLTNVEQKTIFGNSAYEIEFNSSGRMTQARRDSIEKKVVDNKHLVKDYLGEGKNPLLSEVQLTSLGSIKSHGNELISMYIQDFVATSRERYLLIPDQEYLSIDVYLQDLIYQILDVSEFPQLRTINVVNLQALPESNRKTLWDVLLSTNPLESRGLVHRIEHKMNLYNVNAVMAGRRSDPYLRSLYYTTVNYVYLPPSALLGSTSHIALQPGNARIDDLECVFAERSEVDPSDRKRLPVKLVTHDDYYVLSEAFYKSKVDEMSQLEFCVYRMLRQEQVNIGVLLDLCERCYTWGSLERFYYVPILLILLKYTMVNLTS